MPLAHKHATLVSHIRCRSYLCLILDGRNEWSHINFHISSSHRRAQMPAGAIFFFLIATSFHFAFILSFSLKPFHCRMSTAWMNSLQIRVHLMKLRTNISWLWISENDNFKLGKADQFFLLLLLLFFGLILCSKVKSNFPIQLIRTNEYRNAHGVFLDTNRRWRMNTAIYVCIVYIQMSCVLLLLMLISWIETMNLIKCKIWPNSIYLMIKWKIE